MVPNFFNPLGFKILIKRLPNCEFFTQQSSIPNISVNPIVQPTRFNPIYQIGDVVTYSNLDMTFILDEDMKNYTEIFNWMIASAFPQDHMQHKAIKETAEGLFSDISIMVLNNKKNANIEIIYKNCFPISLSDVQLNTTDSDVTSPQVTASFQYDSFTVQKLLT